MKKNNKVLVVEDDKFLLKACSIKFKKAGINVTIATDGVTGLELAKKEMPAVILLDLMLPRMNGFEFLRKIKGDEKTKNIPVIIISVLGQKTDQEKAISLGAEDYFIKADYKLEEIVGKVKNYLQLEDQAKD